MKLLKLVFTNEFLKLLDCLNLNKNELDLKTFKGNLIKLVNILKKN